MAASLDPAKKPWGKFGLSLGGFYSALDGSLRIGPGVGVDIDLDICKLACNNLFSG